MLRDFFSNDTASPVDDQIDAVLDEMGRAGVNSDEYPKLLTLLERLSELKEKQIREPLSRDTVAMIAGNLLGILLIVAYEQKHVMTSQGFKQIIRPR